MSRELVFINVCPDDLYFAWQVEVFIENYLRLGFKHEFQVLLYVPPTEDRKGKRNEYITKLEKRYEKDNVKFFWYPDSGNCLQLVQAFGYLPLLRPYTLYQHFKKYSELKDKAVFYTDQDICFTK